MNDRLANASRRFFCLCEIQRKSSRFVRRIFFYLTECGRGFSRAPFPDLYEDVDCVFRPVGLFEPLFVEECDIDVAPLGLDFLDESLCWSPPEQHVTVTEEEEQREEMDQDEGGGECEDNQDDDAPPSPPRVTTPVRQATESKAAPKPQRAAQPLTKATTVAEGKKKAAAGGKVLAMQQTKSKKGKKKEKKARLLESGKETLYSRAICNRWRQKGYCKSRACEFEHPPEWAGKGSENH